VFTSYRTHAAYLAQTDDVDGFFAELYGKDTGPNHGKAGSMHIANPALGYQLSSGIVAAQIPIAVGAAYAYKVQGSGNVAVVFFGDGALNEGAFWESLNLACLMELPVLFVCEDNGYAVHTPTKLRQGFDHIAAAVRAFRCHAFVTLATDVERIYSLTTTATEYMNTDPCPTFLAIRCYRYLEHVGVNEDYDAGYRTRPELEVWQRRDPVLLQRQRLGKLVEEQAIERLEAKIKGRISKAVTKAQAAPFPSPERGWLEALT